MQDEATIEMPDAVKKLRQAKHELQQDLQRLIGARVQMFTSATGATVRDLRVQWTLTPADWRRLTGDDAAHYAEVQVDLNL